MSYLVLARKWRPRTFSTLVGQDHVVRALTHALSEKRLHHAYLFTGTRGVGKTTIARIFAKSLNCESGVTVEPCGQCSSCQEIDSGRFVDLLEVDAATNTRVDEMRQLLENAVYAPTRGRYKVYVIDEVHMLSNSAFNAMLKTLEEPPEHVKFILATTDPQKIPVTVLSRCLQFNLKQMAIPSITKHLSNILEAESIAFEPAGINLIARSAAGSMRDALSLLDQAIAHGSGAVNEAQVRDMLGTVDLDYMFDLLDLLVEGDPAALVAVADEMLGRSLSFEAALQELAVLLTRIQVAKLAPAAIPSDAPERGRLMALAEKFDSEFVQLAYQIVLHGRADLPLAPDEYAGFVMTLMRLKAFSPGAITQGGGQGAGQGMGTAAVAGSSRKEGGAPASAGSLAQKNDFPMPTVKRVPERAQEKTQENAQGRVPEFVPTPPKLAQVQQEAPPQDLPSDALLAGSTPDWGQLLDRLALSGMSRELAQHCELYQLDEACARFRLSPAHRHLQMKPAQDKLQAALARLLGRPIVISIELVEPGQVTPAEIALRSREERQEKAVSSIEGDSFVREVIEIFDAQLVESSIKPI